MTLPPAVELPQLGQLLQELVDRCCIATSMLRLCQTSMPQSRTTRPPPADDMLLV